MWESYVLLLAAISNRQSIFASEVMNLILNLAPADKILQERSSSLVAGYDVIKSAITKIGKLRNDAEFEKILQKPPVQLSDPRNILKKSSSFRFREYVITEHIRIHNESESLKDSYFEITNTIQSEFSYRFSEFNMSLIKSLRAMLPAPNSFFDKEELQPLRSLVNSTTKSISEDPLDAETTIVKSTVSSKLPNVFLNENTHMNLDQVLKWFWKFKAVFPTI